MRPDVAGQSWLGPRGLKALVAASLLCSQCSAGLYDALGRPVPDGVTVLGNLMMALSVITWFRHYSRVHDIVWVFDMGAFLLSLWVFLVPFYVLTREGWRGARRVGLFVAAYVATTVVGEALPRIALALHG